MSVLKFSVSINAPKEKVWETLWNDATYRQWTTVFYPGSHAESDWKEGSRILFLGPEKSGMFSTIEKKVDNEKMVFLHHGEIKNGVEDPKDYGTDARESYFLKDINGVTELTVELGAGEMTEYFENTFPKALAILKEIAEK